MALALVQSQVGGAYNTPGPQFIVPGNATGNLAIVFAAWDVSQNITSNQGVIPVGAVADQAGNWWRLAGDSGSVIPGCRVAAWVCANALPCGKWLSVCPQGYVSSFEFIFAELSGLPSNYWPLIDFSQSAGSTSSTTLSTAGTATVADFCFNMAAIGSTAPSITQGQAGWTTITTASQGGGNPNGVKLTAQFGTFAAGAVPSSWTYSAGGMVAAMNFGLTQASNLPTQINPNFPRVFVEAAFGASPGDPTMALLDTGYTDLSSFCIGPAGQVIISTTGGRAYELSEPEAGTCSVGMNNQSGAFNPANSGSPYFPHVVPGVPLRVSAQYSGRRYPIWAGFVERWPQEWPDMPQWGWSTLYATDAVGVANSVSLPSAVQGEINADVPYFCFPFSEQYTSAQNTVNGVVKTATATDGQAAINTAPNNQRTATYIDGFTIPVTTGQSLNFLGDSGTGMGASGVSGVDITGFRGPGAQYGPDTGLPQIQPGGAGDLTFEFWFIIPSVTLPASQQQLQLFQMDSAPYLASNVPAAGGAGFGGGVIFTAGITLPVAGSPGIYAQGSWQNAPTSLGNTTLGTLNHLLIIFSQTIVTFWLNGVNLGIVSGLPASISPVGFAFGLCTYAFGFHGCSANETLAYATLHPYTLQAARIINHYQAGISGFSGDTFVQRAARYLAWAKLNLGLAGPAVTDTMQLSSAYATSGTPLASSINADATSTNGLWFVSASGNLVLYPRNFVDDQPSAVIFGDNVAGGEVPYEASTSFDYDNTYLQNSATATLQQGPNTLAAPLVRSPASVSAYFQRGPLRQAISAQTPGDAADRANWSLNKYANPALRVRQMKVNLASRPSAITAILQTGLASSATVNRRPLGQSANSYSLPVTIGKIQHDIGPGKWEVTYQMYPNVPDGTVLETDTSGSDVLGSNVLGW